MSRTTNAALIASAIAIASTTACSGGSDSGGTKIADGTPKITSFTASQQDVAKSAKVTLSWKISGGDTASIDISASPGGSILDKSTMLVGSVETPAILATTVFKLSATSAGKTAEASLTVTVSDSAVSILSFDASPNPGPLHGTTTLSWTTAGATRVRVLSAGSELFSTTAMLAGGTYTAQLDGDLNVFKLEATNGTATDSRELTVAATGSQSTNITESEPNNDLAHANALSGATAAVTGMIMPADDVDDFSVQVPAGGSLYALTSDGSGGCNLDTVLTLYSADGTLLGSADEGGIASCSEMNPALDAYASNLAAGTYYLEVASYSASSTGTYTLTVVAAAPGCGNRVLDAGEQCDDGNTTAGDGCNASCQLETAGTISGTGGQIDVMLPATPESKLIAVTIAQAGQSIEANTGTTCTVDTVLALIKDGTYLGFASDGPMMSACAAIGFPSGFATDLDPGTYYLEVANEGATAGTVTVSVTLHTPACGNGATETRAGEQCDDGNMNDSDGCSNACRAQSLGTVMGPPGEQTFSGALAIGGQALYTVTMTAAGYISAETFLPAPGTCDGEASDTELALLDSNMGSLGSDSDSGAGYCAKIDASATYAAVGPGSYLVRVTQYDGTIATPEYHVVIRALGHGCGNGVLESGEACDDGNSAANDGCSASCQFEGSIVQEVEPDNSSAMATDTRAAMNQTATAHGAIDPAGDADWYAFEIPAGMPATVQARTYSAVGHPDQCDNSTTDTKLFLVRGDGTPITDNDDSGSAYCSFIDGMTDTAAANLAPGRYYLRVEHYANTEVIASYFLDLHVTR